MPTSTEHTELCKVALGIVVLPLVGFVIQVFAGKRIPPTQRQGDWIPTFFIFGSLVLSTYLLCLLLASPHGIETQRWYPDLGRGWLSSGPSGAEGSAGGGLRIDVGILVDSLTVIMLFVVTLVSFVVHLYSWGYMHGEARYSRFFAYLGLFSFSMLGLCVASNLLVAFVFWELVGVCSYFLIGFYFEKRSAQEAAIKAFVTTRVGDLGFFAAILIISAVVGSLEYGDIFESVRGGVVWAPALLTLTALLLFLGPMGKSAQFPFHIWLPDAMEGPTPVSALIHAATMVAAGVYLIGRMFPFMAGPAYFEGDFVGSDPLFVVALIGGVTAFFAATIAFAQTDIKKVLAYSTVSQLGYMMLGLGVGSLSAGLFHLTTHAFFKALLFLGAGSVIHAVHSNELADMGGLRRKMPLTWATFLVATLAIAGLPLFSGFYSKEAILLQAFAYGRHHESFLGHLPFVLGITTAGMTAFYMFRLFFSTFHGEPRNHEAHHHAHESPWTMTVPLVVLAVLSVVAGGIAGSGFNAHWFEARVSSQLLVPPGAHGASEAFEHVLETGHVVVPVLSVLMFLLGVGLSTLFFLPWGPFYGREVLRAGTPLGSIHAFLSRLWYVDAILVGASLRLVRFFTLVLGAFDRYVVDGAVNAWAVVCRGVTWVVGAFDYEGVDGSVRGTGKAVLWLGLKARKLQTGLLQQYVTASVFIFAGLFALSLLVIQLLREV